jgi:hypothetical protein
MQQNKCYKTNRKADVPRLPNYGKTKLAKIILNNNFYCCIDVFYYLLAI